MAEWQDYSTKRIIEVKQRIQTIVVYGEIDLEESETPEKVKEAVVDSFDRPLQAQYT